MKHIKKFNEENDLTGMERVKVKDLIEYLQTLDPETNVELDKNGWDYHPTPLETIQNTYLFDKFTGRDGKPRLIINN